MSRRQNQWFVPGDGIAREVITADIQRYLGPDALVKPGSGTGDQEGVPGYWITAYRTLTTQMIQDLKLDSQRWRAESGRVAYKDSRTHESRQYYGPSQTASAPVEYPQSHEPPPRQPTAYGQPPSNYPTSEHYTHVPQAQYQSSQSVYGQYSTPRNPQVSPYGHYSQQPQREPTYQSASDAYQYGYGQQQQPASEPPRQPPVYSSAPSTARPGYYIASDGREYPLSAQPQPQTQQPAPNSGRRRG
jgi:hypothetical protein